jgi:hypothetical protein
MSEPIKYLSDEELFENFIIIVYSPNPLRDMVTLLIDDEKRIMKRETFIKLLNQTLNGAIPEIKESLSKIEMSIYEFGGWFFYDRETNQWGDLLEQPDTSRMQFSKIREDILRDYNIEMQTRMLDLKQWRLGPSKNKRTVPVYQYYGRN